jgi:nicotinate-nucleotide--dimethylbenzimidazole phosphoribosyltransferase
MATSIHRGPFDAAVAALKPADAAAARDAAHLSDRLTKPRGALGRLETIGSQLAAIAGACPPPVPAPAAVAVFAADHGVVAEGVTPWPSEVTGQMVANFVAGGAAINVLARHAGARVVVVDVGVSTALPDGLSADPGLIASRIRSGSGNIVTEPAMTGAEALAALDVGATLARRLVAEGAGCLVTGDMGIGNTTPSAALLAVLCGRAPSEVTGRGTGIDDASLAHKVDVVTRVVARLAAAGLGPDEPLAVLAQVGGLEIAALAGFIVGGAAAGVPVVVDGVIALAAAVAAHALAPDALGYCIAGHRSTEPGASVALRHLGLEPVLDLELRLGEGTGACLAVPVIQAAAKVLREMATFDAAGVTDKEH